jgi:hypothetical protein
MGQENGRFWVESSSGHRTTVEGSVILELREESLIRVAYYTEDREGSIKVFGITSRGEQLVEVPDYDL